jgi:hypothetical protein
MVLTTEVMIALEGATDSSYVGCAELRIPDLDAWASAASGTLEQQDPRLSVGEVAEYFAVAWQTAAEVLPGAVKSDAEATRWAFPPVIDLRLIAEGPIDNTPQPVLDQYIDLSPLGQSDRGQLREMSVTITAPPVLERAARQGRTREALAYMAQQFGFLDATADRLQMARRPNP